MKLSWRLLRFAVLWASCVARTAHGAKNVVAHDGFLSRKALQEQQLTAGTLSAELDAQSVQASRRHAGTSVEVARGLVTAMLQEESDFGSGFERDLPDFGPTLDSMEDDLEGSEDDEEPELGGASEVDAAGSENSGGASEVDAAGSENSGGASEVDAAGSENSDDASELECDEDDDEEDCLDGENAAASPVAPEKESEALTRPSAKENKVDVIRFGLFAWRFFGVDLTKKEFGLDCVMTTSWSDARVKALVPEGLDTITLSGYEALYTNPIWLPEIDVTNRGIRQISRISTTVILDRQGTVTKVDRSLFNAKNEFDLDNFPFAVEELKVKIASTKYMADEVKLEPMSDTTFSGVADDLCYHKGFSFKKFSVYEQVETSGGLSKSRGVLNLTVKAEAKGYLENHVQPTILCLLISWAVFWVPFGPPQFSTPRLALSILALVVFTKTCVATNKLIPLNGPFNWNDCFNSHVNALLGVTISFNVYCEFAFHQLKMEEVAKVMNHELKIVFPVTAATVVSFVLVNAIETNRLSAVTTGILTDVLLVIVFGCFALYWGSKLWTQEKKFITKEAQAARRASMALMH